MLSTVWPLQVLASIGQLEFFYDQAPDVMRSCSMALQLLSVAAGSYLSGLCTYCVFTSVVISVVSLQPPSGHLCGQLRRSCLSHL